MTKLTVEQALKKAESYILNGKFEEAKQSYLAVLSSFPNNKKAKQGLESAINSGRSDVQQDLLQTDIARLIGLYNQGQFKVVSEEAKNLTVLFPEEVALWNIFGASAAQSGNLDQAVNAFEKVVSLKPNNASSHYNLGNTLKDQGKLDEAIRAYKKALKHQPNYDAARNNLDLALKARGQLEAVTGKYNQDLSEQSIDPAVCFKAAFSLQKQGKLAEAIEFYEKVLSVDPEHSRTHYNLGLALQQQGDPEKAIEFYNKSLLSEPNFADAYYNKGCALKDLGLLEQAIEAYNHSISIKPDYAEAYNNIGIALKRQGKLKDAIEAYKKSIFLKPDSAETHSNFGSALNALEEFGEAVNAFNKAIQLNPGQAELYLNIGNSYTGLGQFEEAITAYKNAIKIRPDYALAFNNLGACLANHNESKEAIKAYKSALKIEPRYAEAYTNMGNALNSLGKLEEAKNAHEKSISIKPDYEIAYNNLGNTLTNQGQLEVAIKAFNKAISLNPSYADAYNNLGIVLSRQDKLEDAIELYNKSISLKPNCADVHKNLSFAFLNIGRIKEGLDEYEWRWKTTDFLSKNKYPSRSLWDGKSDIKDKKILLWCEQGIGDTINWASHASFVASQTKHCVLECQEKLVPLLARSLPNVDVRPQNKNTNFEKNKFDFHIPLGSLYRYFNPQNIRNIKRDAFLLPDPLRVNFWRDRLTTLGNGPYVGISWKSTNMSPERLPNYAPLSSWSPVLKVPGVTFINLQYKDFSDDLNEIQNEYGVKVHNFDDLDHFEDLDDVAALCAALDTVVSIKMTVPLISAGVGTKTKLANWRQSVWNNVLFNPVGPSIDIFERNTWETWDNVFDLIAADISSLGKARLPK